MRSRRLVDMFLEQSARAAGDSFGRGIGSVMGSRLMNDVYSAAKRQVTSIDFEDVKGRTVDGARAVSARVTQAVGAVRERLTDKPSVETEAGGDDHAPSTAERRDDADAV